LIIGGLAGNIWQLREHPEHLVRWGIDCLVKGEAEKVAGPLFADAVSGRELPASVVGTPLKS
jgi:hypothetical protein